MRRRWCTCPSRWRRRVSRRRATADGLVAAGGGAAIGLAKIIARELGLPILAVPTTYSGSEATPIWGMSDGERKFTGKDARVLPRTIVYDPDLTLALPRRRERRERHECASPIASRACGWRTARRCWSRSPPMRRAVSPAPAAGDRRRLRPRGAGAMPGRRVARRCRAHRRHRAAAQARPRARRPRPAARRDPRDHPAACRAFQSRGGGGARARLADALGGDPAERSPRC